MIVGTNVFEDIENLCFLVVFLENKIKVLAPSCLGESSYVPLCKISCFQVMPFFQVVFTVIGNFKH